MQALEAAVSAALARVMARDFGRIYSEGDRWVIACHTEGRRWRIRAASIDGGRTWVPLSTRELAEIALDAIRFEVRSGVPPLAAISPYLRARAPERTFRAQWARFYEAKWRQGRTTGRQLSRERLAELRGHRSRGHLDALLDLAVERVTFRVLEDWRDGLFARGLASGTVHHAVADVGTFLRWLHDRREIPHVPRLPSVHIRRRPPRIPDPPTQARIFEAIPWPLRGVFLARGKHGLRPSEARRARLGDWSTELELVELGGGISLPCHALYVRGKGHRDRVLPIPAESELARWVLEHARGFGAEPLFRNPNADPDGGGWWTKASTRRVWLEALRVALAWDGEPPIPFEENQAMRHAYATALVNRGVPLPAVGAALGHTDPRTTRRYAELGMGAHAAVLAAPGGRR